MWILFSCKIYFVIKSSHASPQRSCQIFSGKSEKSLKHKSSARNSAISVFVYMCVCANVCVCVFVCVCMFVSEGLKGTWELQGWAPTII